MNSTETKSSCTRELQVDVPVEIVAKEAEALLQKYTRMAKVPGFRQGKVPPSVVRQRFADELKQELIEHLVPRHFLEEADKQGLKPISEPHVTDLSLNDGEPLRFKASFEVLPEIEIGEYQDLRPETTEVQVSDEEVDKALEGIREQQSTYTAVEDRPLQDGDYAQISFTGTPHGEEGQTGKPVTVDDVMLEIGGSNTVREFSENLRGAAPGDQRTFDVIYPPDFADNRLAGSSFTYAVTVKGVKQKSLPELNDEFAKQVGDFETFAALRQRVRDGIQSEKEHDAEHEAKNRIVDTLAERHEFPVPEALIDHQVDLRLSRGLRALAAQGMRAEDLRKMDMTRLRAGQRDSAVKEVKVSLILDRIAELEKIEVTDDEVNVELQALAHQAQQPVEELRARLAHEGVLSRIKGRLRNEKTLDFLYRRPA